MTGMAKMTSSNADEAPKTPVVDMARIKATYAELKKMQVKLDPNPIEYGPKRFNNRIAQVRALLNRVEQIFLQTSEDWHVFKRLINAKRTLYEFDKRDLMVNDPRCRVGRSQGEREALADVQLRPQLEELAELELAAHDLETVMISIKSKRTDLKDAQSRMRDQLKLIEQDIGMGARWGNNAGPSLASQSVDQIHSLLDQMDAETGSTDDEEDEEVDETEDEEVETEDSDEEDSNVIIDDAHHDPAPHVDPEPVLTFGEEPEAKEETEEDDGLIPTEEAEGSFPESDAEEPDAEVDDFLNSLGSIDEEEEESSDESSDAADGPGIDDLIASFSDD